MKKNITDKKHWFNICKELLEGLNEKDNRIYTNKDKKTGERNHITLDEDHEIYQCYDEKDSYLKEMPKYWFVLVMSGIYYLISCFGNKLLWLRGHQDKEGYWYTYTTLYDENNVKIQRKKIKIHNLLCRMFPAISYTSPKAMEKHTQAGIFEYGAKKGDNNSHHMDMNNQNNDPHNIETLNDFHSFLHRLDDPNRRPVLEPQLSEACEYEFGDQQVFIGLRESYDKNGYKGKDSLLEAYDLEYYLKKHGLKFLTVLNPEAFENCKTDEEREYLINLMKSINKVVNS